MSPDASRVTFIIEKGEIHIENLKDPEGYQRIRQRQFTTSLTSRWVRQLTEGRKLQASDFTTAPAAHGDARHRPSAPGWRKSPARLQRWAPGLQRAQLAVLAPLRGRRLLLPGVPRSVSSTTAAGRRRASP
jgi:hypothetical protein